LHTPVHKHDQADSEHAPRDPIDSHQAFLSEQRLLCSKIFNRPLECIFVVEIKRKPIDAATSEIIITFFYYRNYSVIVYGGGKAAFTDGNHFSGTRVAEHAFDAAEEDPKSVRKDSETTTGVRLEKFVIVH